MKGSKVYSLNILQIRKGISTMNRHNKNKNGVSCYLLLPFTSPQCSTSKESPPERSEDQKLSISFQGLNSYHKVGITPDKTYHQNNNQDQPKSNHFFGSPIKVIQVSETDLSQH